MNKIIAIPLFLSGILFGQNKSDSIQFKKISDHILTSGQAYEDLRYLTKNIGHRLSGSEAYEKSVKWAENKLRDAGAEKVWLQEVRIPVWVRGKETMMMKSKSGSWQPVKFLSLGNSEGTGGKDVTGEVVVVKNKQEFDQLGDDQIKGKIVLFNYPFDQTYIRTGDAYRQAGIYRRSAASWAGKRGAKAVLIRSLSSALDDVPHTGGMKYDETDNTRIPAAAVGPTTADEMERMARAGRLQVKLNSQAQMKEEQRSHQVIGEIKGSKDNKVIVVAGHLDSWDTGEGAHDDGTGIVHSIEVLRTFKKMGIVPNHTIRVICYANEENGVRGGNTYADYVKQTREPHLFAIESDGGGFTPIGIAMEMPEKQKQIIKSWSSLFLPYGVYNFNETYSGVDVSPLKALDIPTGSLVVDSQRYFDIHHTPEDTFEKVNRRELLLGATTLAQLIYMIDKYF